MRKTPIQSIAILFIYTQFIFGQTLEPYTLVEHQEISYRSGTLDEDSLQRLNLILPLQKNKSPLLIWIGGGAWSYGDKNLEMDFARKIASQGIAVACVGHRLSPAIWRDSTLKVGIQHPKHIQDIASSVKWLYENARTYGYDADNFFIGGYSSGAHLSALLCLDSSYLKQVGISPRLFKGLLPISGTYDIVNYHQVLLQSDRPELAELHVEAVFGKGMDTFRQASPVTYLDKLDIPILLMSDNNMYNYTRLFEEKILSHGFRKLQVVYATEFSHGSFWKHLSFDDQSTYRKTMVNFIENTSAGSF